MNNKTLQQDMIDIFSEYLQVKMNEKEAEGFIVTREIVEEIFADLKNSIK